MIFHTVGINEKKIIMNNEKKKIWCSRLEIILQYKNVVLWSWAGWAQAWRASSPTIRPGARCDTALGPATRPGAMATIQRAGAGVLGAGASGRAGVSRLAGSERRRAQGARQAGSTQG